MSNGNGKPPRLPTTPPPSLHFLERKRSGHERPRAFSFGERTASSKRAGGGSREKTFWGYGRTGQVPYDPQENVVAVISRWRGTMLPLVLRGSGGLTFWGLIFVHFLMLMYNELMPVPTLDFSVVVGLPASLLIFLVVFYNGNCFARFYTLWDCTVDLSVLVHEWTVQTAFLYDEQLTPEQSPSDVAPQKWRASRRVLAALYLLFMAIDSGAEEEDVDSLGRLMRPPNHLEGEGVDDDEYATLIAMGLLTKAEAKHIKRYPCIKAVVPMKWALAELRLECKPDNRMDTSAKNYEALQEIAQSFTKRAMQVALLLQQPVPFAYFHSLKLMMICVEVLIGYSLVRVFEGQMLLSLLTYSLITLLLLGLQEIAGAMADPFGEDDTDFDTRRVCREAYHNCVAYLRLEYPDEMQRDQAGTFDVHNPLLHNDDAEEDEEEEAADEPHTKIMKVNEELLL